MLSEGRPCRAEHGSRVVERRFLWLSADPGDAAAAAQVLHAEESRRSVREL